MARSGPTKDSKYFSGQFNIQVRKRLKIRWQAKDKVNDILARGFAAWIRDEDQNYTVRDIAA